VGRNSKIKRGKDYQHRADILTEKSKTKGSKTARVQAGPVVKKKSARGGGGLEPLKTRHADLRKIGNWSPKRQSKTWGWESVKI